MHPIRMGFAAICAVLFVISSVLVLLLFNLERKAFASETYKQAFQNQGLYTRMPTILATTLSAYVAENGSPIPFLQVLTVEDWQNSIALLLPPAELQATADHALDATFDYLNGRTDSAALSLLPVKAHLAGDAGVQVVLQILRRQPACTTEQLTQMAAGLFGGQIVLCNPPEAAIGLMMPFIQSQVQSMTALFPNEATFISGAASGTPNDPRLRLNTIRAIIRFSPFLPAFLLLGLTLFAVRSFIDLLTWWGWSFMFAAGISVVIGLFGSPLVGEILRLLIQSQEVIPIPPVLASSLAETAGAVARQMLIPVVVQGFILGFIGLGMVIISIFLWKRQRERIIGAMNLNMSR